MRTNARRRNFGFAAPTRQILGADTERGEDLSQHAGASGQFYSALQLGIDLLRRSGYLARLREVGHPFWLSL